MKTLYVSDLDGTLLTKDQSLSDFTVKAISSLVKRGMCFSVATARSYTTASAVCSRILSDIPIAVYNGCFILGSDGTVLHSEVFSKDEASNILNILISGGIYPTVYYLKENADYFSYVPELISRPMREFLNTRKNDRRELRVNNLNELFKEDSFIFTCVDEREKLDPVYEKLKNKFQCLYYDDIYTGERWLEILPTKATKANAVLQLKKMLSCDKIVCFGDAENDISMFCVCDEQYAVANADEKLKKSATGVIESNNDDGVAKWLLNNFGNGEKDET